MNQARLASAYMRNPISPIAVKSRGWSWSLTRSQPARSTHLYNTTPARKNFPLVASLPMVDHATRISCENQYKAFYSCLLDDRLKYMKTYQHLQFLRQEHCCLLHRNEFHERRRGMDIGCEKELETMGRIIKWRCDVVTARAAQIKEYKAIQKIRVSRLKRRLSRYHRGRVMAQELKRKFESILAVRP